jgi:hypothetical protein
VSWRALSVADVEAVPWPGGIHWHPLRMALDVRAFGVGGYSADAGGPLIEPHVEAADGRGHQELYVVLAGRARFTLDGEDLDAPAGTLVAVDPGVHRQAVAVQDGTVAIALGREPDFAPAGSEWLMQARPFMASDPDRARAVLEDCLAQRPNSPAGHFGFALLAAHEGRDGAARTWLRRALALEPRLRAEAEREPLLAPLLS